jgi:protein-tyrosine-phosphatase
MVNGAISVDSAGSTGDHVGESPDQRAVGARREVGINISSQRARRIKEADWTRFTVIAGLDRDVYSDLMYNRPQSATAKLVLFNAPYGVDDPYYGKYDASQRMVHVTHRIDETVPQGRGVAVTLINTSAHNLPGSCQAPLGAVDHSIATGPLCLTCGSHH